MILLRTRFILSSGSEFNSIKQFFCALKHQSSSIIYVLIYIMNIFDLFSVSGIVFSGTEQVFCAYSAPSLLRKDLFWKYTWIWFRVKFVLSSKIGFSGTEQGPSPQLSLLCFVDQSRLFNSISSWSGFCVYLPCLSQTEASKPISAHYNQPGLMATCNKQGFTCFKTSFFFHKICFYILYIMNIFENKICFQFRKWV